MQVASVVLSIYTCALAGTFVLLRDVEQMAIASTHPSAGTFVSGLRREERGLPLHIQTELELLCFVKAAFITGWLCSGSSFSSLSLSPRDTPTAQQLQRKSLTL